MRLLVTGANGFLGRAVVKRLVDGGHDVVAMVRPKSDSHLPSHERIQRLRGDLRQKGSWVSELPSIDGVIHLAAATSGDLPEQFSGTVVATEHLLTALAGFPLQRFVHVSSFSVYDYSGLDARARIDESTMLERQPAGRDPYTWSKLLQERLVRDHCSKHQIPLTVLRPGAIFGPGKTWSFGAAARLGPIEFVFSPLAKFKLTFVDNCADAIVMALESTAAAGQTFNVVDDRLPSHAGFRRMGRRAGARVPHAIYIPWVVVSAAGWVIDFINRRLFKSRARMPEFLSYRRQQARWKPFQYSNRLLKTQVGWSPRIGFEDAVRQMVKGSVLEIGDSEIDAWQQARTDKVAVAPGEK